MFWCITFQIYYHSKLMQIVAWCVVRFYITWLVKMGNSATINWWNNCKALEKRFDVPNVDGSYTRIRKFASSYNLRTYLVEHLWAQKGLNIVWNKMVVNYWNFLYGVFKIACIVSISYNLFVYALYNCAKSALEFIDVAHRGL